MGASAFEGVAGQFGVAVPDGLASAAPVFGAFPQHADAPAEVRLCVGPEDLHRLQSIPDIDALDGRRAVDIDPESHLTVAGTKDVAHHRFVCRFGTHVAHVRVFGEPFRRVVEDGAGVEHHAAAGGAVVVAFLQAIHEAGPVERRRQYAGQPAIGAELGGPGCEAPGRPLWPSELDTMPTR